MTKDGLEPADWERDWERLSSTECRVSDARAKVHTSSGTVRVNRRIKRAQHGGVLPLIMLAATIISALTLVAIAVCALLLVEAKLRSTTDNFGLQAGVQLNQGDRIGEMNLMVERSRESVFTSRKTYDEICKTAPHVEPLARLLLEDSRKGAIKVDEERQLLAGMLGKEIEVSLTSQVRNAKKRGRINLMFFALEQTDDVLVEVGSIRDIPSNATAPLALNQLKDWDTEEGFFFENTKYYRPDVNVKLPAPDNDLKFLFASLAPRIKETIADARLITPDDFDGKTILVEPGKSARARLRNLPSAIRFVNKTSVYAPMNLHEDLAVTTISTCAGSDKTDEAEEYVKTAK